MSVPNPPKVYSGSALTWSTEDVHRAAEAQEVVLTQEEAEQILNKAFNDNECLMGHINNILSAEVENFSESRKNTLL